MYLLTSRIGKRNRSASIWCVHIEQSGYRRCIARSSDTATPPQKIYASRHWEEYGCGNFGSVPYKVRMSTIEECPQCRFHCNCWSINHSRNANFQFYKHSNCMSHTSSASAWNNISSSWSFSGFPVGCCKNGIRKKKVNVLNRMFQLSWNCQQTFQVSCQACKWHILKATLHTYQNSPAHSTFSEVWSIDHTYTQHLMWYILCLCL